MKRVKSACILQTLVFSQKEELGYTKEQTLKFNREEAEAYKAKLVKSGTRHRIVSQTETEDGSVVIRIKKQYNDTTDITEYFNE